MGRTLIMILSDWYSKSTIPYMMMIIHISLYDYLTEHGAPVVQYTNSEVYSEVSRYFKTRHFNMIKKHMARGALRVIENE